MQPSLIDARYVLLHPGEEPVPGFRLVRRRGRGGFGEVWEAEGPGGFLIALKFVRIWNKERSAELRALEFVRGIHHPNLLTNFGSWLVDDILIIGMELADGSLWDRYLAMTRQGYRGIPLGELLGYLAEVAAGIDHLNGYRHTVDGRSSIGIQHRDLKPPNILLFGGGAKVADLGMARAMEGEIAGHTGTWTFPYAAPEFFRGETTRQSDQYGLAATYCQLRGGRLPFSGSAATITAGHLFGRPDLDALPEPERAIVERALAKEPGDRWPNCRAFVAALRALPADAVADILIDPDGPPAGRDDSPVWEEAGTNPSGFAMNSGATFDSRLLLGSTSTGDSGPPVSVPTLILPADPAALGSISAAARPSTRRLRRAAVAGAIAVAAAAVALRGPNAEPGPRPTSNAPPPPPVALDPPVVAVAVPPPAVGSVLPLEVATRAPGDEPRRDLPADPDPSPGSAPVPPNLEATPSTPAARPSDALASVPSIDGPGSTGAAAGATELALEGLPIGLDVPLGGLESPPDAPTPVKPTINSASLDGVTPESPAVGGPTTGSARAVGPGAPPSGPPATPAAPRVALLPLPDRNLAIASLGPVAPAMPTAIPDPVAAEAAYARGREAFTRNAFARAIPEFTEALRLNPAHLTSHLLRGIARHRGGDPRAALPDYDAVLRGRPGDATAAIARGQAYHELGDYARATADYSLAIRLQPNDGDPHFRRGLSRFNAGEYAAAVGDFTEALRLDRNHPYANEFRGEAAARRDSQVARSAAEAPGPATTTPAAPVAPTVTDRRVGAAAPPAPTPRGGAATSPASVRETTLIAPPAPVPAAPAGGMNLAGPRPRNQPPTANPTPKSGASQEKRRGPVRRILPWPFSKGR